MTQEKKQLLLKDLCARLPYGVIVQEQDDMYESPLSIATLSDIWYNNIEVKPYLRPMSSMPKNEIEAYYKNSEVQHRECWDARHNGEDKHIVLSEDAFAVFMDSDFLNSHYLDWRGLIEKGLALEAPEGMYKTE